MKIAQTLFLSSFLLVAISLAQQDIGMYLEMVVSNSSRACQIKYMTCGGLQTSNDLCRVVNDAKQCATTGSVVNDSIAICADTEYQRALDVACMTAEQRQKLGQLLNAASQMSSECQDIILSCFGRLVSPISLKEYCSAIKNADDCLLYFVSVKQSCKPSYEEIRALACSTGAQNIVQNITFLILACVLSLISRDLLVK